ncbi:MAG: hypothetical protein WC608_00775 [Parcubacteria group bacterium]
MKQQQSTATPSKQRWTVDKIDELTKRFSTFERKNGMLNLGDGITFACTMFFAKFANENFTTSEILDLISAFNGCHHQKDAIKRYLIMEALFFTKRVPRLLFNGQPYDIYKRPPITLSPTQDYFEKGRDINKAKVYGMLETSYIGIPRITGKITTGLCRCCRDYEVDKIEIQKIVDIASISNLHLEKNGMLVISSQK